VGEANDMLANIRSAEETFRAENTDYLNVSTDLTLASLYPSSTPNGSTKTQWGAGAGATAWAALNVNPSGPVRFGYAVVADQNNTGVLPAVTNNGTAVNLAPLQGQPWFVATAVCDIDSQGAPDTTLYAISGSNAIMMNNEGM
jgi:hypothetical protein